ncbi:exported hypothetical protein [Mesorhizobium plurifarium]|uniref:Uncharacterized protein n=1 Tax=Mesorhizobium plurifarium TaxID=69974 RepID=A0A090DX25_MESPL|nr:exported hypothetical protein [Mesorhizobium plurifarium]
MRPKASISSAAGCCRPVARARQRCCSTRTPRASAFRSTSPPNRRRHPRAPIRPRGAGRRLSTGWTRAMLALSSARCRRSGCRMSQRAPTASSWPAYRAEPAAFFGGRRSFVRQFRSSAWAFPAVAELSQFGPNQGAIALDGYWRFGQYSRRIHRGRFLNPIEVLPSPHACRDPQGPRVRRR